MKNGLLVVLAMFAMVISLPVNSPADSIDDTNKMIIEANDGRLVAFGEAMAGCADNAACQVAVAMAFAGNMGQQSLFRPETVLDWIREGRNWLAPLNLIFGGSGDGDRGSNIIRGDGNVVMVGNKTKAETGSYVSQPVAASHTRTYDQLNRTFTGVQPITDTGLGVNEDK